MTITGKILLDPDLSFVCSGQSLDVEVKIENTETIFIKGIFLNIRGAIKIKWDDLDKKNKHGQVLYFMQQYENHEYCLDHYVKIQNMDVLGKGEHKYNVTVNVPHNLPQCIETTYGGISYEIILILKWSTGKDEILHRQPIEMKGYLNISKLRNSMLPFRTIYNKSFLLGMCGMRPLKLCLYLPEICFLPGDIVKYYAFVQSSSRILELQRLTVILCQTLRYRALTPKTRQTQVHLCLISKSHSFNTKRDNLKKIEGSIKLPETLTITSEDLCSIRITYKLQFIIVFKGFFTDGYVAVPITVGSHRDVEQEKIRDFSGTETKIQIENPLAEVCI